MNQQSNSEDITEAQEFQSNSTSPKLAFVGSVITEAEVFGDLTDFKHAKEVEIPDQKDGGFTILHKLKSISKINNH